MPCHPCSKLERYPPFGGPAAAPDPIRARRRGPLLSLSLLLVLPLPAAAGIGVEWSEVQVNSYTDLSQWQAAVAAAPDGRFVVVWQSATSPGDDASDLSVQAQLFDVAGAPVGAQFQVNTFTTSTQSQPDVAMGVDGSFVVVWQSFGAPVGGDQTLFGIRARGFTASGDEAFAEIQVNDQTSGDQIRPSVTWVGGAELAFAWQTSQVTPPGGDGSGSSIQARRFTTAGLPIGAQFLVNTTTSGFQTQPEVSADGAGGFAIVWASDDDPSGTALFRVRARRYAASGVAGSELLVDDALNDEGAPSIAHGNNGFVVVWQSLTGDPSGRAVRARRYGGSGAPLGAAWTVDDVTAGDQTVPSVAVLPSGQFLIAWQSDTSSGGDVSSRSVQAKVYDAAGVAVGGQFQINVFAANAQDAPTVAAARYSGRLVAAWESNGSSGTDHSLLSVQARSWLDAELLFADDFETGGRCRWSMAAPPPVCA